MSRPLAVVALAVAAAFGTLPAAPANAACEGKVAILCLEGDCPPDQPCTPVICAVYVAPRCVV